MVTFGPIGRLVATAVVGSVLLWFLLYAGLWGWPGLLIWGGYYMPRALRDIWRPAALPPTDLTRLRDETARQAAAEARPLGQHLALNPDQAPPTRW